MKNMKRRQNDSNMVYVCVDLKREVQFVVALGISQNGTGRDGKGIRGHHAPKHTHTHTHNQIKKRSCVYSSSSSCTVLYFTVL